MKIDTVDKTSIKEFLKELYFGGSETKDADADRYILAADEGMREPKLDDPEGASGEFGAYIAFRIVSEWSDVAPSVDKSRHLSVLRKNAEIELTFAGRKAEEWCRPVAHHMTWGAFNSLLWEICKANALERSYRIISYASDLYSGGMQQVAFSTRFAIVYDEIIDFSDEIDEGDLRKLSFGNGNIEFME